jgi:hypothetical protein
MSTYRDKFLEAEEKASLLVDHLAELKENALNFRDAGESLSDTHTQVSNFIKEVDSVIKDQRELISVLKEIGTQEIIDAIESNQKSVTVELTTIKERINITNILNRRLQNILYLSLVLIVIVGILVIVIH